MIQDPARLPLRLMPADGGSPVGLRLTRSDAAGLLARIAPRIGRYATLRLALAGGEAVLFAPDTGSGRPALPWCATPLGWLAADGPLLLPFGCRLAVPAPWRAEVARRLLDRHGLGGPALLVPEGETLRLLDLAGSRAVPDIDTGRLGETA
ncbi:MULTISPECIES: hypothetical protein [unclassified Methylobacterium]|uniref:hypothetical protein n=1 Tax=unclassified Methylobacterium TaxID=2615210 RepID=UPI000FE14A93|nr:MULTISPECIES: hypothetical protein [unclassified Methylobacterium]